MSESQKTHSLVKLFVANSRFLTTCLALMCLGFPLYAQDEESLPGDLTADAVDDETGDERELSPEEQAAALARQARMRELSAELAQRQSAIEDLQSEVGIYHPSLIENYSDLAAVYLELEDFDSAANTLNDALQIARINNGLYSEQQLPILDDLIASRTRAQDWQRVDDLVHLDHHIASRVFEMTDQEYLAAADDYGKWKLRLLRENLLQLSNNGLYDEADDLSEFYGRLMTSIELSEDVAPEDLITLLYGKSQADMTLARSIANTPYSYFQGTVTRYITQTRCRNTAGPNGQLVRQCFNVQVENPRYRQSQIDAKRFAVNRSMRQISLVIERMESIRDTGNLSATERQNLETQIANLKTQSDTVYRDSRRRSRF